MTAPQPSVRSAKARDLAHELSAREKRPIHAFVEDSLVAYANHQPKETPTAFLKRLRTNAVEDIDLEALIADNRRWHDGLKL